MRLIPQPVKLEMLEGNLQAKAFSVSADDEKILAFANQFSGGEVKLVFRKAEFPQAESYTVTVDAKGVDVTYSDPEAAFRACTTLKQILAQTAGEIPYLCIEDYPAIKNRGYMLDISRGRVPKLSYLKKLVDQLADLRYNQFQLYIESLVYEYKGLEQYLVGRDVLTCTEIQELDAYCKERFIDLVPNQNSLGHMQPWIEVPDFAHLGIDRDDEWPTTTINPLDPGSLELVERIYAGMMDAYTSKFMNVGMDEPFELGMGQTREKCEQVGIGTVYTEYLNKIIALAKRHGKTPMFWDDVVIRHPEQLDQIDKDAIFLDWGYEEEKPMERHCRELSDRGLRYYICPGDSMWRSFTGRSMNAMRNITTCADVAKRYKAEGLLMTNWGNLGHAAFPVFEQIPMIFAAVAAWEQDEQGYSAALRDRERRIQDALYYADRYYYGCKGEISMADIVFRMGNYYQLQSQYYWNETEICYLIRVGETPNAAKVAASKRVAAYMEGLKAELAAVEADETALQEAAVDCDLVIFFANWFAGNKNEAERQRLLAEYERLWLRDNFRQGVEILQEEMKKLS